VTAGLPTASPPDCKTLVSQWVTVRTEATLLRLLKATVAVNQRMAAIYRRLNITEHKD
jgi:hypothetical protein